MKGKDKMDEELELDETVRLAYVPVELHDVLMGLDVWERIGVRRVTGASIETLAQYQECNTEGVRDDE